MFNIKALALATAVSAGVVFAMPIAGPASAASVKVHVGVNNKHKSTNWWARHCAVSNDVKCGHHYTRFYHHRHDRTYYGHYRPYRHHRSGVSINVN